MSTNLKRLIYTSDFRVLFCSKLVPFKEYYYSFIGEWASLLHIQYSICCWLRERIPMLKCVDNQHCHTERSGTGNGERNVLLDKARWKNIKLESFNQ
jgi:hypothetical protein